MTETTASGVVLRTRDYTGWDVVDRTGEKIGTVGDLLIDRTGRVRFLDVEHGLPRKHVLLPQHQLEWGDGRFILGRWMRDDARALPPYDPERPLDETLLEEMERAYPAMYHPEHPAEPDAPGDTRVVPLKEAKDFKVEAGAPDLRGWNVFGSDGERVGTAVQLLVDPAALKARYLEVDVLEDLFGLRDDRHVLVPLEVVELKERGNDAWVGGLTAREVARLPAYIGGAVPPWMERSVAAAFAG